MKKILTLGLALMLVLGAVIFVSADVMQSTPSNEDQLAFVKDRMDGKIAYVEQLLEDGKITQEQAKLWMDHFTEMLSFHEENGFVGCPAGGRGPGQDRGLGRGTGMGMGRGNKDGTGLGRGGNGNCIYNTNTPAE